MTQSKEISQSEKRILCGMESIDFKSVLEPLLDEFKSQSDRIAVIVGAAQLDALLADLLAAFMLDGPKATARDADALLGQDKPLGSFSARIKVAYRLGLIGRQFAETLDLIRKIRNDFAHKVSERSLNKSPHRERVAMLSINMPSPTFWKAAIARYGDDTPASRFRAVVSLAATILAADVHGVVRVSRQTLLEANWDSSRRWPPSAKKTREAATAVQHGIAPDGRSPAVPARR
jgi:hypothetical protein